VWIGIDSESFEGGWDGKFLWDNFRYGVEIKGN